jgi:hypothetical protein
VHGTEQRAEADFGGWSHDAELNCGRISPLLLSKDPIKDGTGESVACMERQPRVPRAQTRDVAVAFRA